MVNCMRSFKDFYKQYIVENRRILITVNLILFVLLPVYSGYVQVWNYNRFSPGNIMTSFITMVTVLFVALSILVPIYNFRFLYKKNYNELYFSLPIERKKLFLYISFSGFLTLILSLFLHSLIVLVIVQHLFNQGVLYILLLALEMFVFYSIATAISVRSNHIFDTLAIGAGYLLLPVAFISSINYIVYTMIQRVDALHLIGVETYEIVPVLNSLYIKFFTPVMMVTEFGQYFFNTVYEVTSSFDFILLVYWLIIAGGCFYLAYVSFNKRAVEESQETTKTILGYPLLVNLFALCILCMTDAWFEYLLVFIIYCLVIFFSERKIKISSKNILSFVIVLIASIGLRFSVQQIDLMKRIDMIPTTDVEYIHMELTGADLSTYFPEYTTNMYGISIHGNKADSKEFNQFLKKMYDDSNFKLRDENQGMNHCFLYFETQDKPRYRHFEITEKGMDQLIEYLATHPNIMVDMN